MIKRIVGWFVLVPLSAVLVMFALANRHLVEVRFDPFSADSPLVPALNVPLFAVIYLMLVLGIGLGGIASWFAQGRHRRDKRRFRRETERLTREVETLKRRPAKGYDPLMLENDDMLDEV